ncbi:MAG: class II aldolase/adducin family protein [Candidatus Eremiobacteraeota bacterium]|nr:class II aldolase/adducin family protein [Candidatus Eremiobacteraeota bacterium]
MVASLTALSATPALAQAIPAGSGWNDDLVTGNRILADQEILDGFGHLSMRSQTNPTRFWMSRSMAPALVTAADIMEFDLDGNAVDPRGRAVFLERFIHSEIYKSRPDVNAVVHAHTAAMIPFGVSATPLRPLIHVAGFLGETVPIFEIRDVAGDATDLLVRNAQLGAALARSLGAHPVALMRGHGYVAVASSVRQCVYRAIYTVVNAQAEAEALRLGTVKFLTPGEAKSTAATMAPLVDRPWDLWKTQALGER